LERGQFAELWTGDARRPVQLTASELSLFVEGCTLVGKHALSPPAVE
jgi:transposase